ncbi:MAG: hypothetical protein ACRC5R_00065 [Mycoplasmatales bacterium]
MSNFKVDRFLKNLSPEQKNFVVPLINEIRKSKLFCEENFKGESIVFKNKTNELEVKIGTKAVTITSNIEINNDDIIKINKKLSYNNKMLKIIYNKTIKKEQLNEIIKLYI